MQINTQLAKSFNRAVTSADNTDPDGNIIWNFVDADVHMDVSKAGLVFEGELNDFIEYCITEYLEFGEIEDNGALAA